MYVYGGPGSQLVTNEWMGSREAWFYILAERGYLVACVDNRGTGGRGRDFSHITYGQLGKYEVEDQLASARYLGGLPYVDESRIGIWGWSYGGYMAALSLFLGSDVFKAGIAVAPVTNWRFYDTIYTERYLQTPQRNPEGYDQLLSAHPRGQAGRCFFAHSRYWATITCTFRTQWPSRMRLLPPISSLSRFIIPIGRIALRGVIRVCICSG